MAVILNGIRVTALVLITEKFGIEYSSPESIWHDITGLIIFVIGIIMILLSIRTMDRFDTPKKI
jgi:exosortase/archaeosortase family protein